jgi:pimeloyl-ACP methyl ester carboxylesterase
MIDARPSVDWRAAGGWMMTLVSLAAALARAASTSVHVVPDLSARVYHQAMATLNVNGVPHAYDEAGEGSVLLLLHAGIVDRRMWDDVWRSLSTRHRVVRFDLRGYGETPLPDGPFVYAADAAALLAELGVERAHVAGVSMGAGVALDLALAHPAMVDRLVLIGAGVGGWDYAADMDAFDAEETAALERGDLDEASWINVRFWVDGNGRPGGQADQAVRQRVYEMQKLAFQMDNDAAEGGWLVSDRHLKLGQVRAPTLVAVGEYDRPDMIAIARKLAEEIPDARLEVLPGVAHVPPMEAPAEFSRLLLGYLRE